MSLVHFELSIVSVFRQSGAKVSASFTNVSSLVVAALLTLLLLFLLVIKRNNFTADSEYHATKDLPSQL